MPICIDGTQATPKRWDHPNSGSKLHCRQSVTAYLERFGFRSPLLKAMYAATDGTSAFTGDWNSPGTGTNFLLHNMVCRVHELRS